MLQKFMGDSDDSDEVFARIVAGLETTSTSGCNSDSKYRSTNLHNAQWLIMAFVFAEWLLRWGSKITCSWCLDSGVTKLLSIATSLSQTSRHQGWQFVKVNDTTI